MTPRHAREALAVLGFLALAAWHPPTALVLGALALWTRVLYLICSAPGGDS